MKRGDVVFSNHLGICLVMGNPGPADQTVAIVAYMRRTTAKPTAASTGSPSASAA